MDPDSNKMNDKTSMFNYYKRVDEMAREYQIAVEYQSIIGERLAECARVEGVNQFVNCRQLADQYIELINDKYHGMIFPPGAKDVSRQRLVYPLKKSE